MNNRGQLNGNLGSSGGKPKARAEVANEHRPTDKVKLNPLSCFISKLSGGNLEAEIRPEECG